MTNRRVKKLEAMFRRIANRSEIEMIDKLYASGSKGPAVRKMTDRVAEVFFELLDEKELRPTSIIRPFA